MDAKRCMVLLTDGTSGLTVAGPGLRSTPPHFETETCVFLCAGGDSGSVWGLLGLGKRAAEGTLGEGGMGVGIDR